MTTPIAELIAIAIVTWLILLIPMTQATRTVVAVVAVILALFVVIHSGIWVRL